MENIIVHASDWHGRVEKLPWADIYCLTGDMLPDLWHGGKKFEKQIAFQNKFFQNSFADQEELLSRYFSNVDATIIYCRGNHCYIDPGQYFGDNCLEIGTDVTTFEVNEVKFAGYRGTEFISGCFSDGLTTEEERDLAGRLPEDADIILTHAPPYGILDDFGLGPYGMKGLSSYLNRCVYEGYSCKAALFGHIHEEFGSMEISDILCVNSATGYTVLEMDSDKNIEIVEQKYI